MIKTEMEAIKQNPVKLENKPPIKSGNPYKGLSSYEEIDKNVYHGREEDKKKLINSVSSKQLNAANY